ncbi:hypothetical protein [Rhodococcus opacus]|uniref:hypothetical protein n=1 Tax=Rhodococcus opacus TaxID=37919 RepID=UPI00294A7E1E|nr:hypothetical protein [Rhodococcus opacus]MDV6244919.1 hypothetical protein [Rhodococcus opacus]
MDEGLLNACDDHEPIALIIDTHPGKALDDACPVQVRNGATTVAGSGGTRSGSPPQ